MGLFNVADEMGRDAKAALDAQKAAEKQAEAEEAKKKLQAMEAEKHKKEQGTI